MNRIVNCQVMVDIPDILSLFQKIKYFIHQKIERVKELLAYGEKNISEIADELDYSSVAHLSNQFKKVTGLTPSHFKKIGYTRRLSLDKV